MTWSTVGDRVSRDFEKAAITNTTTFSRTEHRYEKLARARWTRKVDRDRSFVRTDRDAERKKSAAMPLCVHGAKDLAKDLRVCGKAQSKAVGKFCTFSRTP